MNNISIKELFKQAQNGDKEARDYLIESNMKLVYKIAHKFRKENMDFETALQEGSIGLVKAVDSFKPELGYAFSTYASAVIMRSIQLFKRYHEEVKPFRLKISEYKLYKRICEARKILTQEFHEEPKVYEIAIYLGEDISEVGMIINALENYTSIYSMKYRNENQNDLYVIDSIKDNENALEECVVNKIVLAEAIEKLTPKQKKVIQLRYYQNLSQVEIGQALNISQAQISRIEKKALAVLKEVI